MDKKGIMATWLNEGHLAVPQLLFKYYARIGLTEEDCMLLLQVYTFLQQGVVFPTPEQLAERMTLTVSECTEKLRKLVRRRMLSLEQQKDENCGLYSESYSLEPLWEKLVEVYIEENEGEPSQAAEDRLYALFEEEFGRPLSPIEGETLTMWIDEDRHSAELIKAALQEAVLSGKLNFRYIDRILFEWQKKGIQTREQAKRHSEQFYRRPRSKSGQRKEEPLKKDELPFYNWLEDQH